MAIRYHCLIEFSVYSCNLFNMEMYCYFRNNLEIFDMSKLTPAAQTTEVFLAGGSH